jgi:hypothetical protein
LLCEALEENVRFVGIHPMLVEPNFGAAFELEDTHASF